MQHHDGPGQSSTGSGQFRRGAGSFGAAPLILRLVRPTVARSDLGENELVVQAAVPASDGELTPTGRVRLTPREPPWSERFRAHRTWSEDDRRLTVIAHGGVRASRRS